MPDDDHGVLILRAWIETGSAEPLRVTLTTAKDVSAGRGATAAFSQPEAACAFVTAWLQEFLDSTDLRDTGLRIAD